MKIKCEIIQDTPEPVGKVIANKIPILIENLVRQLQSINKKSDEPITSFTIRNSYIAIEIIFE